MSFDASCLDYVAVVFIGEDQRTVYCNPVAREILSYPDQSSASVAELI